MNKLIGTVIALGINVAFGYLSAAAADTLFGKKEEKHEQQSQPAAPADK